MNFSGTIKVEDLFHYMQHKEQFNKPLKRKDFRDAIEEIERDIQNGNTDGGTVDDSNVCNNGSLLLLFICCVNCATICFRLRLLRQRKVARDLCRLIRKIMLHRKSVDVHLLVLLIMVMLY